MKNRRAFHGTPIVTYDEPSTTIWGKDEEVAPYLKLLDMHAPFNEIYKSYHISPQEEGHDEIEKGGNLRGAYRIPWRNKEELQQNMHDLVTHLLSYKIANHMYDKVHPVQDFYPDNNIPLRKLPEDLETYHKSNLERARNSDHSNILDFYADDSMHSNNTLHQELLRDAILHYGNMKDA